MKIPIIIAPFFCIIVALLFFIPAPVLANDTSLEPIPLIQKLLQQRVKFPISNDGFFTIDLQNFIIDLTPENAQFRDHFYQLLQSTLNQPGKKLI